MIDGVVGDTFGIQTKKTQAVIFINDEIWQKLERNNSRNRQCSFDIGCSFVNQYPERNCRKMRTETSLEAFLIDEFVTPNKNK